MSQSKETTLAATVIRGTNSKNNSLKMSNISSQQQQPLPTHLSVQSMRPIGSVAQQSGSVGFPLQLTSGIPLQINQSSLLAPQSNISTTCTLPDTKKVQLQINSQLSNCRNIDSSEQQKCVVTESSMSSSYEPVKKTPLQIKIHGVPGAIPIQSGRSLHIANNPSLPVPINAHLPLVQTTKAIPHSVTLATQQQSSTTSSGRSAPHMIYIQTSTGLKPFPASDIVPTAPVRLSTSSGGSQLLSSLNSKTSLVKTVSNKPPILTGSIAQSPIVLQKPKVSSQNLGPAGMNPNTVGKHNLPQFLNTIKKPPLVTKFSDQNQKVIITPMNVPKMQNSKILFPSKGPVINFQIQNGQIQNDPQGNITVMQDTNPAGDPGLPPLQPISTVESIATESAAISNIILDSKTVENTFTTSIPGSRAELIGEQEYTLSIPDNSSVDDVITVSISEENEANQESYTINIPNKQEEIILDNNSAMDCTQILNTNVPGILKRSNSNDSVQTDHKKYANDKNADDIENKIEKAKMKLFNSYSILNKHVPEKEDNLIQNLYCEEKMEQELEAKTSEVEMTPMKSNDYVSNAPQSVPPLNKDRRKSRVSSDVYLQNESIIVDKDIMIVDEDSLGLQWNNNIADLKGSNIRFRTNEFGLIVIVDNDISSSKTTSKIESKKPSEEFLYCYGCGCHGMPAEFINPHFCCKSCQVNYKNIKDKDAVDLKKKRKPRKSLLLRTNVKDEDNGSIVLNVNSKDRNTLDSLSTDITVQMIPSEANVQRNLAKSSKWKHENGFIWVAYLEWCGAIQAPESLFKMPTSFKHDFKPGMKVEAMDPVHQSLFTVVTITEVQGYRLKLHFDGYHENYDFWVNANSSNIFPPGWCEKNGKALLPPKGYVQSNFSWAQYVKQAKAMLAPRYLFSHLSTTNSFPNGFRVGNKLEAEDRKNSLTCVATVADVMDNKILIHFDSWDDIYDYWVHPTSPYIHPVGWCDKNGYSLTPPNTHKDPENFTWDAYLKETKSHAVPARVFKPRPPHQFRVGMKLEAVDKRVPFLIRVATVSDVRAYQIRISFDGLPDELSFWVDDDSPDIYPVGWCLKTGHPLEPPLTSEEISVPGSCGTKGCQGLGNALGFKAKTHSQSSECPYRLPPKNMEIPDRLASMLPPPNHSEPRPREPKKLPRGRPPKNRPVENDHKLETQSDEDSNSSVAKKRKRATSPISQETVERSVFEPGYTPNPNWNAPPTWGLASHCMPLDDILQRLSLKTDPRNWSQTDVQEFVEKIAKSREVSWRFCKQRIDGESFLMLAQEDLVSVLGMRLGPAIKIYNSIIQLRKKIVV